MKHDFYIETQKLFLVFFAFLVVYFAIETLWQKKNNAIDGIYEGSDD